MRVGILGFGIVGCSALRFITDPSTESTWSFMVNRYQIKAQEVNITVWDKRLLTEEEMSILQTHNASYCSIPLASFLEEQEIIIVSPGFNTQPYQAYRHKFLYELDIFAAHVKKPVIALTGTVGKTSITRHLGNLLAPIMRIGVGGNIGTGMLDLAREHERYDYFLLELSSFQLEHASHFHATYALWNTFFANHLDRHSTYDDYFKAKANLFKTNGQISHLFITTHVLTQAPSWFLDALAAHETTINLIGTTTIKDLETIREKLPLTTCYYEHEMRLVKQEVDGVRTTLFDLSTCPPSTFLQNWLCIITLFYTITDDLSSLERAFKEEISYLEHRVEHLGTYNNVTIYNDSKATVPEATLAAIEQLSKTSSSLILILGGMAKGVPRTAFLTTLLHHRSIKKIVSFGPEWAAIDAIETYPSLQAVVEKLCSSVQPGDTILFSPSGASFDFFKNYEDRGTQFKQLVKTHFQALASPTR